MYIPLKERNKNKGVSEIIATILLLSITLVITSTLWFWVQGFLPTSKSRSPTASAYVDISDIDYGVVYIFIEDVSERVGIMDVKYYVYSSEGATLMKGRLNETGVYGSIYIDSNYDGVLNDGDFFSFDMNREEVVNMDETTFSLIFQDDVTILSQKIRL